MYDRRKDPKQKQLIRLEKHEFHLDDKLPQTWNMLISMFGEKRPTRGKYEPSSKKTIYMIRNTETGKMYIGQTETIEKRKSQHATLLKQTKHENTDMQMDYIFYGLKSFIFEIIEFLDVDEDILEREKYWIKRFGSEFPNGYNAPYGFNIEYFQRISKKFVEEFIQVKEKNYSIISGIVKNKENILWLIKQYQIEQGKR